MRTIKCTIHNGQDDWLEDPVTDPELAAVELANTDRGLDPLRYSISKTHHQAREKAHVFYYLTRYATTRPAEPIGSSVHRRLAGHGAVAEQDDATSAQVAPSYDDVDGGDFS